MTGWGCSIIHIPLKLPIGKKWNALAELLFSPPCSLHLASSPLIPPLRSVFSRLLIARSRVVLGLMWVISAKFNFLYVYSGTARLYALLWGELNSLFLIDIKVLLAFLLVSSVRTPAACSTLHTGIPCSFGDVDVDWKTRRETLQQSEIMWNAVEPERYSWTEQKGMMDVGCSSNTWNYFNAARKGANKDVPFQFQPSYAYFYIERKETDLYSFPYSSVVFSGYLWDCLVYWVDMLDDTFFHVFYSNFAIRRTLKLDVPVLLGGFGSFPVGRRRLFFFIR